MNPNTKILVDADILSHFMASGNILSFHKIFKNQKLILKIVADEIRRHKNFRHYIDRMIEQRFISEIAMPNHPEILKEFAELSKTKGKGESACMAVARYSKDIIASNNWRDIKKYCELHSIAYLSTLDFIYEAYRSEIMTLSECDLMIYSLLTLNPPAKLPHKNLKEFCDCNNRHFPLH